jgi:uncharacterized membrane protein
MRPVIIAAALAASVLAAAPVVAAAEDHEAGVPLTPAEAAGAWTVESAGRNLCVITLGAAKTGQGYAAKVGDCGQIIPGGAVAWQPTADGMRLVGADGAQVIAFNRWSNSMFVSHRASGVDMQLKRGAPGT